MKIGILTYHCPYNFGANLQAFATVSYLKNIGHVAKIIDYGRDESNAEYRKMVPSEQWPGHDKFIEKLPLTRAAATKEELVAVVKEEKFDGILVGADAVWSYPENQKGTPVFFMDWLFEDTEISKIPVASLSVNHMGKGFKHLDDEEKQKLKRYVDQFTFLTVRDKWTKKMVNNHLFDKKVRISTLNTDPVFTLQNVDEEWNNFGLFEKGTRFILVTYPGKSDEKFKKWHKNFLAAAHKKNYLVGELPLPEGNSKFEFDFVVPYPIDPVQWYLWIKNASGFIGLRFHAVVSSITNETPFFSFDVYGNRSVLIKYINKYFPLPFLGAKFDYNSKIFNLLRGTNFSKNRVQIRSVVNLKPQNLISIIEKTDIQKLKSLKLFNAEIFRNNMDKILNSFLLKSK